ncbi:MAG: Coenzyme F420 hydrogenase/dehydrogenase, beta subunit C-terminal domain [Candidatus Thorarchaeota archaeon]
MSKNVYIARSSDESLLKRGESGGAVTAVLKCALENGDIDGVVTVKSSKGDRFAGLPVMITNPEDLINTAGSLHCSLPNIPRFVKEYLDGAAHMKLAVVGKPCDIRAIIEIQKRKQINIDNVILIGLNCTGTIAPAIARKMYTDNFKVDPSDVIREDIEDGELIITLKDGTIKSKDLAKLEKKGLGRRENCRRCEYNIPTFADLAFGKWGTEDVKDVGTFVEVLTEKGKTLFNRAIEKKSIEISTPTKVSIETRARKDKTAIERAREWRERDFTPLLKMDLPERYKYWTDEFIKCIKCFGCRDACPICNCETCLLEANRDFLVGGEIPPNGIFPLTRLAHVADSCVGCGQCQDACPMELPLSKLFTLLNSKLNEIFEYEPGIDVEQGPPTTVVRNEEQMIDETFLDVASMMKASVGDKEKDSVIGSG